MDGEPKRPPTPTGACGEYKGVARHRRRGERLCLACCEAQTRYFMDRYYAPQRRAVLLEALAGFDRYRRGPRT